jgi:uncharacterized protein (TIRG00374 family)
VSVDRPAYDTWTTVEPRGHHPQIARSTRSGHTAATAGSPASTKMEPVLRSPLRRRLTRLLLVAAALAAAVFAITQRQAVADAVVECGRLDRGSLAVAVGLAAIAIVNRGFQTRRAYAGAGLPISRRAATTLTATSYSANKVIKSGGVVGLFAHLHDSRRRSLDRTRTVAAYVVITLSSGIGAFVLAAAVLALASVPTFLVVLCIGAVALWATGRASRCSLPRRIVAHRARRVVDRFSARVDVDDVSDACRSIARARDHLAWVAVHSVITKLIGALLLVVVLQGFGVTHLGVEETVRLYALTFVAAALGPFPAGIGTTEASLAGLLVAADVDGSTAMAVTVVFRAFDLFLPIAFGAITAPFVLRRGKGAPAPATADVSEPALAAV